MDTIDNIMKLAYKLRDARHYEWDVSEVVEASKALRTELTELASTATEYQQAADKMAMEHKVERDTLRQQLAEAQALIYASRKHAHVEMPEPVGTICFDGGIWYQNWVSNQDAYSESQLRQYGDDRAREALEMAAVAAWSFHMNRSKRAGLSPTAYEAWSPVSTIRALAKEIK